MKAVDKEAVFARHGGAKVHERFDDPKQLLTELADWFEADPSRWCQGISMDGRACVISGCMKLTSNFNAPNSWNSKQTYGALELFVARHKFPVPEESVGRSRPCNAAIIAWNDAKRRTVKQVVKALREAAR